MKYEGPFEILQKISPLAYRLRMPASYGMHPVINIAHLERYVPSPPNLGTRSKKKMTRLDFEDLPEYEVESIIAERMFRTSGKRGVRQYRVRFTGYGADSDEWLTKNQLKNAPEVLENWQMSQMSRDPNLSESD